VKYKVIVKFHLGEERSVVIAASHGEGLTEASSLFFSLFWEGIVKRRSTARLEETQPM
jgi:hypothetical protein